MSYAIVLLSGSAANSRSSTQMNSYSDSGYQEVSGYYSNLVTPRRSEGRSQSTSSAPSFSPSLAMGSRAEGQALAQVRLWTVEPNEILLAFKQKKGRSYLIVSLNPKANQGMVCKLG